MQYVYNFLVVTLFSIFLSLPLKKLLSVYAHFLSLFLFGFAHYLSIRYVRAEQDSEAELQLDEVCKLEWHGSHILAQVSVFFLRSV